MARLGRERITFIQEEGFKDADRVLLSGLEHKIIGSKPEDLRMESNPRIPMAIVNGSMTIKEANELRRAQVWFADTSLVDELGGLESLLRYITLIKLPELDPTTGELSEMPHLYGFFDEESRSTLTVEQDLDQLPIDPTRVNTHIARKIAKQSV